jgi:hypothetical protein
MSTTVSICCEGIACNNGISARERETIASRGVNFGGDRGAALLRDIRGHVTRALRVTPHEHAGYGRGGSPLYVCLICGHERQYGGSSSFAVNYEPARVEP